MKYKLIKEYPGSLKLGTVVEAPEDCQTRFIIEDGVCFTYDQGLLDRYPGYWEKMLPEEGLLVSPNGSLVYKLLDGSGYGFDGGRQSGYYFNKGWNFSMDGHWKPATPEQENKFIGMLKIECERRGLFEDTKIEAHANGSPLRNPDYMGVQPIFDLTTGYNRNGVIFHRGKFATPLKETTTMPQVGKQYTHKKGNTYTVTGFTNNLGDREDEDFPVTVVYMDQEGRHWSRPLSRWHGSFELKK